MTTHSKRILLLAATLATLTVLPPVDAMVQARSGRLSPSMDPNDPMSRYHGAS